MSRGDDLSYFERSHTGESLNEIIGRVLDEQDYFTENRDFDTYRNVHVMEEVDHWEWQCQQEIQKYIPEHQHAEACQITRSVCTHNFHYTAGRERIGVDEVIQDLERCRRGHPRFRGP